GAAPLYSGLTGSSSSSRQLASPRRRDHAWPPHCTTLIHPPRRRPVPVTLLELESDGTVPRGGRCDHRSTRRASFGEHRTRALAPAKPPRCSFRDRPITNESGPREATL